MRLYELLPAYVELETMMENPDTADEQIAGYLDACKGELQEKVMDIGKFIRNLEATSAAIEDAEKTMAARRKTIENRVKSIKAYVLRNMQASDVHKLECEYFKIVRQKNPPSVVIDDEAAISVQYWRQPETPPPSIDKKAILDDIKNGVIVDGAHMEQTERVSIK